MAFPTSPANGDTYSLGGVTYTYNSSTNQWVGALPTSSSGGGGSMGAPSSSTRFMFSVYANATDHSGGNTGPFIGSALTTTQIYTLASKIAAQQGVVQLTVDPANYGSDIEVGGTLQDFSSAPQFCDDASYLASNPTWIAYGAGAATNGSYYCASGKYVRYTNNSGATFNTYIPQPQPNGNIKLKTVGKYKVKVNHLCDVTGNTSYSSPYIHTVLVSNGNIIGNAFERCTREFQNNDPANGLILKLRANHEFIVNAPVAGTEFTIGTTKLGTNMTTSHYISVVVETLF